MGLRMRMGVALLVTAAASTAAPARALPTAAGLYVTIDAPSTFVPGEPITVSGYLVVAFALPVVVEVGHGLPDQEIQITVDGTVAATVTTADDGSYAATIALDAQPPASKILQAVAFEGSAIETRSRTVHTTIDRILTELTVTPASIELTAGAEGQLLATGLWDDGRTEDLTDRVAWTSSDETVAAVEAGVVHAHAAGTATVTASYRAREAHATVTVPS